MTQHLSSSFLASYDDTFLLSLVFFYLASTMIIFIFLGIDSDHCIHYRWPDHSSWKHSNSFKVARSAPPENQQPSTLHGLPPQRMMRETGVFSRWEMPALWS